MRERVEEILVDLVQQEGGQRRRAKSDERVTASRRGNSRELVGGHAGAARFELGKIGRRLLLLVGHRRKSLNLAQVRRRHGIVWATDPRGQRAILRRLALAREAG